MFIIHVISDTQCVPYIFGEGVLAVQFLQMSKVFFLTSKLRVDCAFTRILVKKENDTRLVIC